MNTRNSQIYAKKLPAFYLSKILKAEKLIIFIYVTFCTPFIFVANNISQMIKPILRIVITIIIITCIIKTKVRGMWVSIREEGRVSRARYRRELRDSYR